MDLLWETFARLVIYILYMTCLIICEHVIIFFLSLVNITSAANAAQVNSIPMLNVPYDHEALYLRGVLGLYF